MVSLMKFIGYGAAQPLVVFLGIEEKDAGGGACAIRVRRTQFARVEDLLNACTLLAQCKGFRNPFAPLASTVPQWNTASRFRLALAGLAWADEDEWDQHWRHHLGRAHGDTLLMDCHCDPAAGLHVDHPRDQQWPERQQVLARHASQIRPMYVVSYGDDPSRYVHNLFPIAPSTFRGSTRVWHSLQTRKASSIARGPTGTVVARVGFFGQGRFALVDLDPIVAAMTELGTGPAPLRHQWP